VRPGDPNAWELTAPEVVTLPDNVTPGELGWLAAHSTDFLRGYAEGARREGLTQAQFLRVAFAVAVAFLLGAIAGGWRP
jgi:hypothetical protein